MAHCACKNAEMNQKSTTTNGFNFRIINSLKYAWPGLTVMKHGKFRFLRWRQRLWDCSYGTFKSRKKQISAASACFLQPFTWETRIECHGNCLIDVEENPSILKRFWQRRSQVIRNSCKLRNSYQNCLAILRFSDSPWDLETKLWDSEFTAQTVSLTVKPWELEGL